LAHIGIICHPARGRLYPMLTVGRALRDRGHEITVVGHRSSMEFLHACGFESIQVDRDCEDPVKNYQSKASRLAKVFPKVLSRLPGRLGRRTYGLKSYSRSFNAYYDRMLGFDLDVVRPLLEDLDLDLLLGSDTSFATGTIAELKGIPLVSFCTGVPLSVDPRQPPEFTLWKDGRTLRSRLRNRAGNRARRLVERPILQQLNAFRRARGLVKFRALHETLSEKGCLCQFPTGFDFPIRPGQSPMFYTGPTLDHSSREQTEFPWDRLDGRPIVYASIGTVSDSNREFSSIASACADLPVQLVITRGGGRHPLPNTLPGDPLIVDYAPQIELIKRARVVITHSSANTVMETLANGVPLICIPQGFDRYGTAVRAARSGAAVVVPPRNVTPDGIRHALEAILEKKHFTEAAIEFKRRHEQQNPTEASVRIIEACLPENLQAQPSPDVPEPFTVTAEDGIELRGIRWNRHPEGPLEGTVLCLHGLCSDCNSMELVGRHLSRAGLDVIAPDYRGHGLSDATSARRMSISQFARDARTICARLNVSETWLFTQSLGGQTGIELLRTSNPSLDIKGLFAFAPPWRLRKAPLKKLPRALLSSFKHIRNMARTAGYNASRTPSRQDYALMRDMPDFYQPVMREEIKSVSLRRFARLFLNMKLADYGSRGDWTPQTDVPIHLYAARHDRYINNRNLEELAEHQDMSLTWIDCHHVSLMTNEEHAREIGNSIIARISEAR
jgi:zeaxanthin glucosyltransferase